MKIARISHEGTAHYAVEHEEGKFTRLEGDPFGSFSDSGEPMTGERLSPVLPPTIYGIGLNYREHAGEMLKPIPEFPVVFMKSPTAVQDPGKPIVLPPEEATRTVDYEAELAVVIGKICRNVSRTDALAFVLGFTCANDVTARNWQTARGGGQFCRAKTFDTFCPLGPRLVTLDEIDDPGRLRLSARLNGETVQDSTTSDLIFDVPALVEFLSIGTTLQAGTVILTGTPPGVGVARNPPVYLQDGDRVAIEIEGIGILENPVVFS